MTAIYLKADPNIGRGKADKHLFNKRALVGIQVFSSEGIGNPDYELVPLITYANRFFEPSPVVWLANL